MTQNERLLEWLRSHDSGITTLEASDHLRICRLSERIRELERAPGILIDHDPEKAPNGARVIRYRLLNVAYG